MTDQNTYASDEELHALALRAAYNKGRTDGADEHMKREAKYRAECNLETAHSALNLCDKLCADESEHAWHALNVARRLLGTTPGNHLDDGVTRAVDSARAPRPNEVDGDKVGAAIEAVLNNLDRVKGKR